MLQLIGPIASILACIMSLSSLIAVILAGHKIINNDLKHLANSIKRIEINQTSCMKDKNDRLEDLNKRLGRTEGRLK